MHNKESGLFVGAKSIVQVSDIVPSVFGKDQPYLVAVLGDMQSTVIWSVWACVL